jgi:putative CocE/NonD family hydrolase
MKLRWDVMSRDEASEPKYDVKMEFGVRVPMRDNLRLAATIFRPDAKGRFPVILTRTPYSSFPSTKEGLDKINYFVKRGYVYVSVDCRGKNDSEGEYFYPLVNEAKDGYDTIKWAGNQPWSNGMVGTQGGSYTGWNQWFPAILRPPHLKTMVSFATPPDPWYMLPYRNGTLNLYFACWVPVVEGRKNRLLVEYEDISEVLMHRPLITLDEAFGWKSRFWKDYITHSTYDDYWKEQSYQDKFHEIEVPVLHVTGWYDDNGNIGNHWNFIGMKKHGRTKTAREGQKLVVGPWTHAINKSTRIRDFDFGKDAVIDMQKLLLRWYDHWLKGLDTGIMDEPPVSIFVMGENKWRQEDEWPLARAEYVNFYLHSGGRANSLHGDGALSDTPPGEEPPDRFTFDPDDPVPMIVYDPSSPIGAVDPGGPDDQRPAERRDDVLVFSTDVLEKEVEVTGPVKSTLYAASDARDTDFTMKLVDVFPNGYAMKLVDGVIRARFRDSYEKPTLIEPGKICKYDINLWYTSNLFRKGHRIRVEVSSSQFPMSDPNPNTGNPIGMDMEVKIAHQKIYHNKEYPSHIILPIISR